MKKCRAVREKEKIHPTVCRPFYTELTLQSMYWSRLSLQTLIALLLLCTTRSLQASPPRRRGFPLRRITGDGTPYSFPERPISFQQRWPRNFPFTKYAFFRLNSYNDGIFYALPRFVYHIDEPAVAAVTQFYRRRIPKSSDILDVCSSWVSHYPSEFPSSMNSISATGSNVLELAANDQLTAGFTVSDLNQDCTLPYDSESFDIVTCVCSIEYMTNPVQFLRECNRVLRPNGKMIVAFSNRCFALKAIKIWLSNKIGKNIELINGFFQYAGGFGPRKVYDITAVRPQRGYQDPIYVIEAAKKERGILRLLQP